MATRVEFGDDTALTVVESFKDVQKVLREETGVHVFTLAPKKKSSEAQPVLIRLSKVLYIREAHVDAPTDQPTPSSGLGVQS